MASAVASRATGRGPGDCSERPDYSLLACSRPYAEAGLGSGQEAPQHVKLTFGCQGQEPCSLSHRHAPAPALHFQPQAIVVWRRRPTTVGGAPATKRECMLMTPEEVCSVKGPPAYQSRCEKTRNRARTRLVSSKCCSAVIRCWPGTSLVHAGLV